ncbi:MAG: hypothetical protein J6T55_04320 [Alphaproteobacteria bacterium]|nr:hypothetical protein [Alphaproteobacteria bacterium]
MDKNKIQEILMSPISRICRPEAVDRKVFSDEKNVELYLFELLSGQQFVGAILNCYQNQKYPELKFRPLPEHNLLPGLKEIQYKYDATVYYGKGPEERRLVRCLVNDTVSLEEKIFYEECLGAKKASEQENKYLSTVYTEEQRRTFFQPLGSFHPLWETSRKIRSFLKEQREAEYALMVAEKAAQNAKEKLAGAEKGLKEILMPQKTNQLIQQKLKERRQNG